jgi:hydrogenase/urease accessory protein HupE
MDTLIKFSKIIKLIIFFYFFSFLTLFSIGAISHEIRPSIADYKIEENILYFDIRLNAELILSGIDASNITDTNSSPLSATYDDLRSLTRENLKILLIESWDDIQSKINLNINEVSTKFELVDINIEANRDFEISRDSILYLKYELDEDDEFLTFKWSEKYGPIIIREINELKKEDDLYTEYLQAGLQTDKIFIKSENTQSIFKSIINYFILGIQHIIPKGLDHILFIVGLFFFSVTLRPLLIQVTMFTIAHSITLIFVSVSYINVNPLIVEPIIALSIAYVGIENIFKQYVKEYLRYIIIFFFGLLHGLGFALVLSDIGYQSSKLILNLISFNLGIEAAQIFIILFLYILLGIKFSNKKYYRYIFQVPVSLFIALVGIYWFFERINMPIF